ncbi:hypothetical protein BC834DRAFT_21290 [Gloeopeniophorella convolvens]|nr:hypothetical protein BC834DRAFT_21290 [Gloeopeniophorella convolvens]
MNSSAFDYRPSFHQPPPFHYGSSYDTPIHISPSPDFPRDQATTSPLTPYSASSDPYPYPASSIRGTASASTPSASSVDTPVHEGFPAFPIIADDSCCYSLQDDSYSYSGQQAAPWMPSGQYNSFDCHPFVPPPSKPSLNGAICGHQALASAPPPLHRVMGQNYQHPSLGYPINSVDQVHSQASYAPIPAPVSSRAIAFPPTSHVQPSAPLVQQHQRSETTTTVTYASTRSTTRTTQTSTSTTTTTVLQNGFPAPAHTYATAAPMPSQDYVSYAPASYASQPPAFAQPQFTASGWDASSASYHLPPYTAPAPAPAPAAPASTPLYQPKPIHPLPEWTKKPSLILDGLVPLEPPIPDTAAPQTYAVAPLPRESSLPLDDSWVYGAAVAGATIEEMIEPRDIGQDDIDEVHDDDDEDEDDYDDEDEDADMEEAEDGYDQVDFAGLDPTASGNIRTSPLDPAHAHGALPSAAASLSSSSLLCQPISDVVQNQFRAPVVQAPADANAYWS